MNKTQAPNQAPSSAPSQKTETVKLLKPHTHAGKARPAGAEIHVDEPTATWLRAAGVIAKTEPAA